jgi:hypothetical protein
MSHDLVAELEGYNNELAREENRGRGERADAVREQIARVRKEIADRVEQLEADAEHYTEQGQDLKAAQAAIDARKLRAELECAGPFPAPVDAQRGQDNVSGTDQGAQGGATEGGTTEGEALAPGDAEASQGGPPLENAAESKPTRTAGRKKAGS